TGLALPLVATICKTKLPVSNVGAPAMVPLPLPLSVKVTPVGRSPTTLRLVVLVAVTWKVEPEKTKMPEPVPGLAAVLRVTCVASATVMVVWAATPGPLTNMPLASWFVLGSVTLVVEAKVPLSESTGKVAELADVKTGAGTPTTNGAELNGAPGKLVTVTRRVVAPVAPTVASRVSLMMTKGARTPLYSTSVTLVKPEPVMFTWVPTGPPGTEKDVMTGDVVGSTVKLVVLGVPVNDALETTIGPVTASVGTVTT